MNRERVLSYFLVIIMILSLFSPQVMAQDNGGNVQSYDEESFYKVFMDREFGKEVLAALRANPDNVDWSLVNDESLAAIKSIKLGNGVLNLKGMEKLSGLEKLYIQCTEVSEFPDNIENSLKNLKSLSLDRNRKPLTVPAFASLTEFFALSGQAITMESKASFELMSNLKTLHLSNSKITDNISVSKVIDYSKFQELESLYICDAGLDSLPDGIKELSKLKVLDVSSNSIGSVPNGFFENLKNIGHLRMSGCKLSSIPDDILSITDLSYLDISYNHISSLPSINNVSSSCSTLDLSGNKINVYQDDFFDSFPNLSNLHLDDCGLSEIPQILLKLEKLTYLSLGRNLLENAIKNSNFIRNFENLQGIDLSNCQLTEFPLQIGELPHLFSLNLYNNNIRNFPDSDALQGKFDNLRYLDMVSCNLTEFPDLACFPNISNLDLQGNFINSVPEDMDLSKMEYGYIDLSNNYFISIPKLFIEHAKSNIWINLSENFIKNDDVLPESISVSPNQLIFKDMPPYFVSNQSVDMSLYLSTEDKLYSSVAEDIYAVKNLVEYTVAKDGQIIDGLIDNDGKLTIVDKGTYVISAKLKDAEEGNPYAKASTYVEVIYSSDFYNEEKFKAAFPDEAFGFEVLKALDAVTGSVYSVDYKTVDWQRVNDVRLSQIKHLYVSNDGVSDLTGLEKLNGLQNLNISYSKINGFPNDIESKLSNLKSLSLSDNVNAITVPKFANLTNLICGYVSSQALSVVQNITKDSIDSICSMKNLKSLSLNNAKDLNQNLVLANSIDYTKLQNLEKLEILNNGFEELPKGIETLKNLVSIDLSYNNLKSLPSYFETSFPNLQDISLKSCKLESFPDVISKLTNLYTLDLGSNDLKEIPKDKGLAALKNLKWLDLSKCELATFPEDILKLNNLNYLYLSHNKIKSLPSNMDAIWNLWSLDISNNEFERFPEEVLNLYTLKGLSLNENVNIKEVPGGAEGIGKLKQISSIGLSNCGLKQVPDFSANTNLYMINLSSNNILKIPDDFNLPSKTINYVDFSNNNISSIPVSIINDAKNWNSTYWFSQNYLTPFVGQLSNRIIIENSKQLAFKSSMPESFDASNKFDLKNYIVYKIGNETESSNGLENAVEYCYMDSGGNVNLVEDGVLSIDKPGTYTVKGIIKGADSTNVNAVATRVLSVDAVATPSPTTTPSPTQASQAPVPPPVQSTVQASPTPTLAIVTMPVDDKGVPAVNPNGLIITADKNKTIVDIKASEDYMTKMIKNKVCEIDLFKEINTISSMVNIPENFIKSLDEKGVSDIRLITPFITIRFSIKEFASKDISKLSINLGKRSDLSLTKEQKRIIGPSEVIYMAFEVENADGKKTELKKTKSPISIKLPYELEGKNDRLTLYSLGTEGEIDNLAAKYDEALKAVTTKTKTIASVSVVNNSIQYNDVKKGNWAQNYIEVMSAKGIVKGYENGIFKPDLNITRAEFASIITRLLKLEASGQSTFTDIKDGDWYKDAVMAAAEANIITGWKGKFMPNDRITREDAAVMISRALAYVNGLSEDHGGELTFRDKKKISLYAEEHIRFVVGKGIMSGKADSYFDPKGYTTRAEVAKMVYMLFEQM
ncbi:MAG TPA: S-layer homology domain-containing protein [Pseudobacteroides sp.]|uniref:S-layer homology domain-containing protein n=1 Tax=Pseudobacteroides sp. TaxID=1968840 RepID=UPI002F91CD34